MGGTRRRSYSFLPAPLISGAPAIATRCQEMACNAAVGSTGVGWWSLDFILPRRTSAAIPPGQWRTTTRSCCSQELRLDRQKVQSAEWSPAQTRALLVVSSPFGELSEIRERAGLAGKG